MNKAVITVNGVSMMFNLNRDKVTGLKEYFIKAMRRQLFYEEFWALKDISFEVGKGEVLGVMGLNGSGKSTLLKIISGVFKPTKGVVETNGGIAPLIELGAGFDPEFSARDNVLLNGAMFGHTPAFMESRYEEIMDFAELRGFRGVPVKNYSSGMVARLGFAVATSVRPDILIVDEILSVGDYRFQAKCEKRIAEIISEGSTVLLVSHDEEKVRSLCSRAMLLRDGKLVCDGGVEEVCEAYRGSGA